MAAALPKPSNQRRLDKNQEFVKILNQKISHKMKSQFENNISSELSNTISSYYFDGHVSFILEFTHKFKIQYVQLSVNIKLWFNLLPLVSTDHNN